LGLCPLASAIHPLRTLGGGVIQLFMRRTVSALVASGVILAASANVAAKPADCMDLRTAHATATVSGVLTVQLFAGPPNYESVAKGDAEEKALILELPRRMCADDGEFIKSSTTFDRVQVSSSVPGLLDVLNASVGRPVTVRGEAFGAHTGHHRAPLVLVAQEVTVR
jgi:hypothetical protein